LRLQFLGRHRLCQLLTPRKSTPRRKQLGSFTHLTSLESNAMKWFLRACGQGKRTRCGDEQVNPGRRGVLGPGVLTKRCSPVRRNQRVLKAGKAPEFHGRLRAAVLTRVHRGRGGTARLTVREDGTRPQDPLVLHRLVCYCDKAWKQVRHGEDCGQRGKTEERTGGFGQMRAPRSRSLRFSNTARRI